MKDNVTGGTDEIRERGEKGKSPRMLSYEEYQEKLKSLGPIESADDALNALRDIFAPTLQDLLETEMTNHLGYEKHSPAGDGNGNSRNGYSKKTLQSKLGATEIQVPRDRNGSFEPVVVKKYQTNTNEIEEKIIAMYQKGMTTRDVHDHIKDIYGVEVSPTMVSQITDKILPRIQEWQSRPLESVYPFVFLDGIHFRVKDSGRIVNKCSYTVLGITCEGKKEILGMWIGEHESASFWGNVLTELKNRGVEDIVICSVDDLAGFSDAIHTVFPETRIQKCIVHLVRNAMKLVAHKDKDRFCADLRKIYAAPTEEAGLLALEAMKEQWPRYRMQVNKWEEKWNELSTFFQFSQDVRKIMYTTNSVEALHRQLRKVTKTTSLFPHDGALMKLLWLAQDDFTRKWTAPIPNWGAIISELAMMFPDRIRL
jgi:transposase-like protein